MWILDPPPPLSDEVRFGGPPLNNDGIFEFEFAMSQIYHVGAPFPSHLKNSIVDYFTTFTGEKTPQNNFFQHRK